MGGIGFGIVLFVVGAILVWAWSGNIPGFDDDALGYILMGVGVATVVLALILQAQRQRSRHINENRNQR